MSKALLTIATVGAMVLAGVYAAAARQLNLAAGPEAALVRDYVDRWTKGDAEALAAMYADDAVMIAGDGLTTGRAAIEQRFVTSFAGPWKGGTFTATPGTTRVLSADVRVIEGTFTVTGLTDAKGAPRTAHGRYLNTLVNRRGTWVVAAAASFEVPAPPPR